MSSLGRLLAPCAPCLVRTVQGPAGALSSSGPSMGSALGTGRAPPGHGTPSGEPHGGLWESCCADGGQQQPFNDLFETIFRPPPGRPGTGRGTLLLQMRLTGAAMGEPMDAARCPVGRLRLAGFVLVQGTSPIVGLAGRAGGLWGHGRPHADEVGEDGEERGFLAPLIGHVAFPRVFRDGGRRGITLLNPRAPGYGLVGVGGTSWFAFAAWPCCRVPAGPQLCAPSCRKAGRGGCRWGWGRKPSVCLQEGPGEARGEPPDGMG